MWLVPDAERRASWQGQAPNAPEFTMKQWHDHDEGNKKTEPKAKHRYQNCGISVVVEVSNSLDFLYKSLCNTIAPQTMNAVSAWGFLCISTDCLQGGGAGICLKYYHVAFKVKCPRFIAFFTQ